MAQGASAEAKAHAARLQATTWRAVFCMLIAVRLLCFVPELMQARIDA
jgi:hypothetical protein